MRWSLVPRTAFLPCAVHEGIRRNRHAPSAMMFRSSPKSVHWPAHPPLRVTRLRVLSHFKAALHEAGDAKGHPTLMQSSLTWTEARRTTNIIPTSNATSVVLRVHLRSDTTPKLRCEASASKGRKLAPPSRPPNASVPHASPPAHHRRRRRAFWRNAASSSSACTALLRPMPKGLPPGGAATANSRDAPMTRSGSAGKERRHTMRPRGCL